MDIGKICKIRGLCYVTAVVSYQAMAEGTRVSLLFPAPGCSEFLSSPTAMSTHMGFLRQHLPFLSVAFYQAQGMRNV